MRQDRYRRDCNERGDETIFDRGRGSLVANEILAFGSHVHIFFPARCPTFAAGPPFHFAFWAENSNLSLTAAGKSSMVRRMPVATVNETLASLRFRGSRRAAAGM
jgi:hypothetical protein